MTQMESPKRKMQKKNDYQRHKLFRKIKRRRKAQAEAEQQVAEKQLRKKLKLPKFGDGKGIKSDTGAPLEVKDGMLYYKETGEPFHSAGLQLPEVEVVGDKSKVNPWAAAGRHNASSYFDGNWSKDLINMAPGIGDAMDVAQVIDDTSKGKYVSAGAGALMLALPNFVEKPFKFIGKKALPFMFNKINTKGIGRYTIGEPVLPNKTIRIQNDGKPFMFNIDQPTSQYIDKDHLNIGSYVGEGGESFVYNTAGDPNTVTKIKVPISDSIEDYEGLQRAVSTEYQQNKLPFFFKQDYLGYTDKNSIPSKVGKAFGDEQFRIVTKQPKVTPFSKVADPWYIFTENDGGRGIFRYFDKDKIYNYLQKYGVEKTEDPFIYKYKNITFSDVFPQNAGIDKNGNFGFLDLIIHDYNSGKDIRIKPSKRGTFTKAAKQHGMSVQGFANKVLKNPSKYSSAMRKKANFAHNAVSWKH